MGRAASHITLECALQTHPNITLIGEEVPGFLFISCSEWLTQLCCTFFWKNWSRQLFADSLDFLYAAVLNWMFHICFTLGRLEKCVMLVCRQTYFNLQKTSYFKTSMQIDITSILRGCHLASISLFFWWGVSVELLPTSIFFWNL